MAPNAVGNTACPEYTQYPCHFPEPSDVGESRGEKPRFEISNMHSML